MLGYDARNHKVTMLKIKNIILRETYGEGEIPHEAKNWKWSYSAYLFFSICEGLDKP